MSFSFTSLRVLPKTDFCFGPLSVWTVYRASQRPSLRRRIVPSPLPLFATPSPPSIRFPLPDASLVPDGTHSKSLLSGFGITRKFLRAKYERTVCLFNPSLSEGCWVEHLILLGYLYMVLPLCQYFIHESIVSCLKILIDYLLTNSHEQQRTDMSAAPMSMCR